MKQIFQRLIRCIKNVLQYPYCITIAVVTGFIVLFFMAVGTSGFGFASVGEKLNDDFIEADRVRDTIVLKYGPANSCTKALTNQYNYLKEYKSQHLFVAKKFTIYYFGFSLIAIIATIIAGIFGLLIARVGWQSQKSSVKAAFIGFVFTASFAAACMNVFNNSENSNKNISKYFYFTNLQTNIYNAIAVGDSLDKKCSDSSLLRVFWENNQNLKDNMNLFLDIKADKIPVSPDINKLTGSE